MLQAGPAESQPPLACRSSSAPQKVRRTIRETPLGACRGNERRNPTDKCNKPAHRHCPRTKKQKQLRCHPTGWLARPRAAWHGRRVSGHVWFAPPRESGRAPCHDSQHLFFLPISQDQVGFPGWTGEFHPLYISPSFPILPSTAPPPPSPQSPIPNSLLLSLLPSFSLPLFPTPRQTPFSLSLFLQRPFRVGQLLSRSLPTNFVFSNDPRSLSVCSILSIPSVDLHSFGKYSANTPSARNKRISFFT